MSPDAREATAAGAPAAPLANAFTARDVEEILRERGWFAPGIQESAPETHSAQLSAWMEHAAALLGSHASDRNALADLLSLIFQYDASASLATPDAQDVMARVGSREVIRELANLVLDGAAMDSEQFKAIVE